MKLSLKKLFEDVASKNYLKSINASALRKNNKDLKPDPNMSLKDFYSKVNQEFEQQSEDGPIFSKGALKAIESIPFQMDKKETQWLANVLSATKGSLGIEELRYILDFTRGQRVDLKNYKDFESVLTDAGRWHETLKNKEVTGDYKTNNVVMDFGNGYKIVEVSAGDNEIEGEKMGHCVGGENYSSDIKSGKTKIFSLRDKNNEPHVTIHYEPSTNSIYQIFGKENKRPVEKYWSMISKFVDSVPGVIPYPFLEEKQSYGKDGKTYGEEIIKKYLLQASTSPDARPRRIAARDPRTPLEALLALSKDKNATVIHSLASNPSTPPEVLLALSKNGDDRTAFIVAGNPNTPPEALLALSKNKYNEVIAAVAGNPSAPPEILLALSKYKDSDVIHVLAENPSAPPEALLALSKHRSKFTRVVVAKNPSTPPEALLALSKDEDYDVRWRAAENPSAPPEALLALSKDKHSLVRRAAAMNPGTPHQALLALSKDEDFIVRRHVAGNIYTPPEALRSLINDPDTINAEFARKNLNQRTKNTTKESFIIEKMTLKDIFK